MRAEKRVIDATFEIVTPMFLGGADRQASRLRETSLKGAFAFWWRALNFSRFMERESGNLDKALAKLREEEHALFGGPRGQGAFLLHINSSALPGSEESIGSNLHGAYYLGFGSVGANGKPTRNHLKCGQSFFVRMVFQPKATDRQCLAIARVVKAFGLFGGLGSRVRRGYGSVALTELEYRGFQLERELVSIPASRDSYEAQVRDLIVLHGSTRVSGLDFPLTAFARETECRISSPDSQGAIQALDGVGCEMQRYRLWDRNGRGPGEGNFKGDHDWFKAEGGRFKAKRFAGIDIKKLPERAAFGLPHNYFSREGARNGQDLKMTVEGPEENTQERRASPLFIHVHKLVDGSCPVCLLYFPNRFLDTPKLRVDTVNTKNYEFDRDVISRFLSRFGGCSVDLRSDG